MRLVIVFLFTAIFVMPTLASNHVKINFREVKNFDGVSVLCPGLRESIINNKERYCNPAGKTLGDAVCIHPSDKHIKFSAVGRPRAKILITAKNPGDLDCGKPEYKYVQNCTVAANAVSPISYTISTKKCEYDPRIIISNQILLDDDD